MRRLIVLGGRAVFACVFVLSMGFGARQALESTGEPGHSGEYNCEYNCDQYCPENEELCDWCCIIYYPPSTGGQCGASSCNCLL